MNPTQSPTPGTEPLRDTRNRWETFAREHLKELVAEIIEWQDTALLRDGRVRELAAIIRTVSDHHALKIAESAVTRAAMEHVALSAPPLKQEAEAPSPLSAERNQCDGCAVGAHVNRWGHHCMPDGGLMACTAHLYAPPAPAVASQPPSSQGEPTYDHELRRLVDGHPLGQLLRWQEQRIRDLTYMVEHKASQGEPAGWLDQYGNLERTFQHWMREEIERGVMWRPVAFASAAPCTTSGDARRELGALLTKLPSLDPGWPDAVKDGWHRCFEAIRALADQQVHGEPDMAKDAARVPEGWKLVPIEPTPEMLKQSRLECGGIGAGSCGEHIGVDSDDFRSVWAAMLAAAPSIDSSMAAAKGEAP
jgi:hypothetical protein